MVPAERRRLLANDFSLGRLISSPCLDPPIRLRTWSSAAGLHGALLHVGQAWSLAHSPRKNGCRGWLCPTIIPINNRAHYSLCYTAVVEGPGFAPGIPGCRPGVITVSPSPARKWPLHQDSHLDFELRGLASCLLDDGGKMARPAGLAPAYLRSTGGRFDCFIFGRIGQVGRNCTDFPGFTGRCPANWATHLIEMVGAA